MIHRDPQDGAFGARCLEADPYDGHERTVGGGAWAMAKDWPNGNVSKVHDACCAPVQNDPDNDVVKENESIDYTTSEHHRSKG